ERKQEIMKWVKSWHTPRLCLKNVMTGVAVVVAAVSNLNSAWILAISAWAASSTVTPDLKQSLAYALKSRFTRTWGDSDRNCVASRASGSGRQPARYASASRAASQATVLAAPGKSRPPTSMTERATISSVL